RALGIHSLHRATKLKRGAVEALWKNCSEKLLLQYGNETAHLKPPQEYMPLVVVNDQLLRQSWTAMQHGTSSQLLSRSAAAFATEMWSSSSAVLL
ncbi:hypothetical protein Gohar_021832, partial [Gossypium harknessii]|nr:hypothetical protein [Gossypium harknessii]